jgi:hypothetical protein
MAEFTTPEFFANGIPTLNQSALDKQFRYGKDRSNELTIGNSDVRDALYGAGWGQKSDASRVLTGAGNYGIVSNIEGMGGSAFKTLSGRPATDQDFINAAKSAGIDVSGATYQKFNGLGSPQMASLDKSKVFKLLQEKGKDLYSVTNAVEGSSRGAPALHATVTYKADGNGNLVPLNNEQTGQPDVKYFNATRYKADPGIMGDLAPFLALLPAVGGVVGHAMGAAGSAAGAAGTGAGTGGGFINGGYGSIGTGAHTALKGGLSALTGVADDLGGLADDVSRAPTGWENVSKEVGLGTPTATNIPADVAEFIATGKGLLSPEGLPYDPYAPGYQIGPEGPAQIGNQCLAFKASPSLLDRAKSALDTVKQGKELVSTAQDLFGDDQPAQDGGGGGGGNGSAAIDGESGFLNKFAPSTKSSGLKTVNKESNVDVIDSDDQDDAEGYAEAGTVLPEKKRQASLEDQIKELNDIYDKNNMVCWEKLTKPKFVCDVAEFLYSTRQSTHSNPLKQIKQGLRVNPLATGGLPHKYAAAAPKGHKPEFITGMTGYYACGHGTGQSDDIPAMLHDGDYVMDAETVSALGDGSSKAGHKVLEGFREQIPHKKEGGGNPVPAKIADGEYVFPEAFVTALGGGDNKRGAEILDGLRTKLRAHKRGAPLNKIPPKAKDPIDYIKTGSK